MMSKKDAVVILMADDDDDDFLLAQKALKKSNMLRPLYRVRDGEELMNYLHRRGVFEDEVKYEWPSVILLDLNMPRKDGREALREIKSDPALCTIPVMVFTTSKADEDVIHSYQLGVNSFITKPATFEGLISVMQALGTYWFKTVELPKKDYGKRS